ncbi:MAG: hypothetical protein ACK5PQ_02155 [Alphaproteobacteria bacterium]
MKSYFYKSIIFIFSSFFLVGYRACFSASMTPFLGDFTEELSPPSLWVKPIPQVQTLEGIGEKKKASPKKVTFDLDRNTLHQFIVEEDHEEISSASNISSDPITSQCPSESLVNIEPSWRDILSLSEFSMPKINEKLTKCKDMLGGEDVYSLEDSLQYLSSRVGGEAGISILESLETFLQAVDNLTVSKEGITVIKIPTSSALHIQTIDHLTHVLIGRAYEPPKVSKEVVLPVMPLRPKNETKKNLIRMLNIHQGDTLESQILKLTNLIGNFPGHERIIESVEFFLNDINSRLKGTFDRVIKISSKVDHFMMKLERSETEENSLRGFYDRFCRSHMVYDYDLSEEELRAFHRLCNPKL